MNIVSWAPPLSHRDRSGSTAWTTGAILVLIMAGGLARHLFQAYQWQGATDRCLAQQVRLQKMLDGLGGRSLDVDMDTIFDRLVRESFLATESSETTGPVQTDLALEPSRLSVNLVDPGFGRGSHRHYVVMAGTRRIGCVVHGAASTEPE